MTRKTLVAVLTCALVAFATRAQAQLVEPAHAKRLNLSFVTAYQDCASPNDSSTGAFVLRPALPPRRSTRPASSGRTASAAAVPRS